MDRQETHQEIRYERELFTTTSLTTFTHAPRKLRIRWNNAK